MNIRGVFFSTDALIALIIILLTATIAIPIIRYSNYNTTIQSDIMNVLSTLKIGEINNNYVKGLIIQGNITDLNKSVLEQIGEFYSRDPESAKTLANSVLTDLDIKDNIGIWYGNTPIFFKNSSSYENSTNIIVERQTISGIHEGGNVTGFSTRSFLSGSSQIKYFYFGGYLGEGNISVNVNYNGNLTGLDLEIATDKEFDFYINGNFSGHLENSSSQFTPKKYDLDAYTYKFHNGSNTFKMVANNFSIAGGFLKISYSEPENYDEDTKYYFPGLEGIVNIYDGFYVPGNLNYMNISLHYNSNATIVLNIGNITVFRGNSSGLDATAMIDNTILSGLLNYNQLSMKTTPLRLGLENISYVVTNSAKFVDAFSVNDVSGSMAGTKLNNAKNATKQFIDLILNYSQNKVGLVAYNNVIYDYFGLSNNNLTLKNRVDTWSAGGNTCICCGINNASNSFNMTPDPSRNGLKAYYTLNNNSFEFSSNINHGTLHGNPPYVIGIDSYALKLNSVSNQYASTSKLLTLPNNNFSISLWINPSSHLPNNKVNYILSNSWNVYLKRENDNTKINESYGFNDGNGNLCSYYPPTINVSLSWTSLIFVKNSSNQLNIYLNGTLVNTCTMNGAISSSGTLTIGRNGANYLNATIDEVRVYNKTLNSSEIFALSNMNHVCGNGVKTSDEECDDGNLIDTDGCSSNCRLNRSRAMVVMSDGMANENTGCSQGTGSDLNDAIMAGCQAWQNYGIKVYSVGFGSDSDNNTMRSIAACANGSFYFSDVSNLSNVYNQIASNIIEGSYNEQTVMVNNENFTSTFYPDSYIEFNYTKTTLPYGLVTTFEKQFDNDSYGTFNIPTDSNLIDSRVVSYSGPRWTSSVLVNNNSVYNLSYYGNDYTKLGDPYVIGIPNSMVNNSNIVKISTGTSSGNSSVGSLSNKIIYRIVRNMTSYNSTIYSVAEGCNWTIEFAEDSRNVTMKVPQNYSGNNICYYQQGKELVYNQNDATEVAVFNLFKLLDIDSDGRLDSNFDQDNLQISISEISGIPYSWSTEVQIRKWD
jgi:cysteine-rich repeat protein